MSQSLKTQVLSGTKTEGSSAPVPKDNIWFLPAVFIKLLFSVIITGVSQEGVWLGALFS